MHVVGKVMVEEMKMGGIAGVYLMGLRYSSC